MKIVLAYSGGLDTSVLRGVATPFDAEGGLRVSVSLPQGVTP